MFDVVDYAVLCWSFDCTAVEDDEVCFRWVLCYCVACLF
jgi:hypothetical protein